VAAAATQLLLLSPPMILGQPPMLDVLFNKIAVGEAIPFLVTPTP
jgi:hypothetical protein